MATEGTVARGLCNLGRGGRRRSAQRNGPSYETENTQSHPDHRYKRPNDHHGRGILLESTEPSHVGISINIESLCETRSKFWGDDAM